MSTVLAATRPHAAPQSGAGAARPQHFAVLDIIRAAAIVLVVAYHLAPATVPSGFLGVDLFFVLSGFLITRGLLRRIERERPAVDGARAGTGGFLREFYRKRLRRLFPAFALMLVTVCSLALVSPADTRLHLGRQVLGALTSTANWVQLATGSSYFDEGAPQLLKHTWSLAVEEQFYLLWPLVLLLLAASLHRRRGSQRSLRVAAARLSLLGAVVSGAAMAVVFLLTRDLDQAHLNTLTHASGLLLGGFVATMPSGGPSQVSPRTRALTAGLALATMAVGLVVLSDSSPLAQLGGIFVFTLAAAVVVRWGTTGPAAQAQPAAAVMVPVRWLAERSYALYLWHWPLIVLVRAWLPDHSGGAVETELFWTRAALVIGLSALAAEVSFRFMERPVLRSGFRGALADAARRSPAALSSAGILALAAAALTVIAAVSAPAQTQEQQRLEALQHQLQEQPSSAPSERPAPSGSSSAEASEDADGSAPADPAAPTSAPAQPRDHAAEGGLSVVGDSVTVAASPEVLADHPEAVIRAEVGQQMGGAEAAVRDLHAQGQLGRTVVLALGTNGAFTEEELDAVVQAAGPDHRFVLVTPYGDRPWIPEAQEVLRDYAQDHPDDVRLADWSAAAEQVGDMAPDGVHPGPEGAEVWARTVDEAVSSFED